MLNTLKIKERMREKGLGQKDIAAVLNVAMPTVSQKINGIRPLYLDEAEKMAKLLQISDSEFGEYFFAR